MQLIPAWCASCAFVLICWGGAIKNDNLISAQGKTITIVDMNILHFSCSDWNKIEEEQN